MFHNRRQRLLLAASAAATVLAGGCPRRLKRRPSPACYLACPATKALTAEAAGGDPVPNFADKVKIVPNGFKGGAVSTADDVVLTWKAAGNIYAQRGTLSFFWRSRYPVGEAPFPIFRVGYADHTSWDMVWLRIDWNGHGYDAFVTDDNLGRAPGSRSNSPKRPAPEAWHAPGLHLGRDQGRCELYVDGKLAAKKDQPWCPGTPASTSSGRRCAWSRRTRCAELLQLPARRRLSTSCASTTMRWATRLRSPRSPRAKNATDRCGGPRPRLADGPRRVVAASLWLEPSGRCAAVADRAHDHASARSSSPTPRIKKEMDVEGDRRDRRDHPSGRASTTACACPAATTTWTLPDWNTYVEGGKQLDAQFPSQASPGTTWRSRARLMASWTYAPPRTAPVTGSWRRVRKARNARYRSVHGRTLRRAC